MSRFFETCLLLLGGIVALWIALRVLAEIWGWLLLVAAAIVVVVAAVGYLRYRRDRRW